jgi:hypothetical protein
MLQNEVVHNLYSSCDIKDDEVKKDELGRTCSNDWGEEKCVTEF